mgnify:CR=1 FL=1
MYVRRLLMCGILAVCAVFFATTITSADISDTFQVADQVQVQLTVTGCNNNGICEAGIGETTASCPLDCPFVSPPSTPTGGGGSSGSSHIPLPIVTQLTIIPTVTGATITWVTSPQALSTFYWGTTDDYEIGVLSESSYGLQHSVVLSSLFPNQAYYFMIQVKNVRGFYGPIVIGSFKTLATQQVTFPANPTQFRGYFQSPTSNMLSWKHPVGDWFDGVRIVRSERGYPRDYLDGRVVYEGFAEFTADTPVQTNKTYYYGAFARNKEGKYSTGTVLAVVTTAYQPQPVPQQLPTTPIDPLPLIDVTFVQNNYELSYVGTRVPVHGLLPLIVRLHDLPEGTTDTYFLNVQNPDGEFTEQYQFQNVSDHRYQEVVLPSFYQNGLYAFTIANNTVSTTVQKAGTFDVDGVSTSSLWWWIFVSFGIIIFLLLLLLLLLFLLAKKREDDEENETDGTYPQSYTHILN